MLSVFFLNVITQQAWHRLGSAQELIGHNQILVKQAWHRPGLAQEVFKLFCILVEISLRVCNCKAFIY